MAATTTTRTVFLLLAALCFSASISMASDHSPLQDFCVADKNSAVTVNGMSCKDPKTVSASDFHFTGLHVAANTSNPTGFRATPVFAAQLPGLNTLGISMARLDFAPWGVNPPHTHPRASEILTVLHGTLEVGFVTSNPENRLITKLLTNGDAFVFPSGLVHYQRNVGLNNAVAIAALSSQNPGAVTIANAVFGSNPGIPSDVLAKSLQLDANVVTYLQTKF